MRGGIMLGSLLLGSCEKPLTEPAAELSVASSSDHTLQDRPDGRDPFSVAVMRQAFRNLQRNAATPGTVFTIDRYQNTSLFRATTALNELKNQRPADDIPRNWIVFGLLHDMTDNTAEPPFTTITDNVTAYTAITVFRGLQPSVTTVRGYQSEIQSQNNGLQAAQMEQLVTSYRW